MEPNKNNAAQSSNEDDANVIQPDNERRNTSVVTETPEQDRLWGFQNLDNLQTSQESLRGRLQSIRDIAIVEDHVFLGTCSTMQRPASINLRHEDDKPLVPVISPAPTPFKPKHSNAATSIRQMLQSIRDITIVEEEEKCIEKFLIFMSYLIVIICFPVSLFCVYVAVRQFERAVILRNGKVYKNKAYGPGLVHFLPCVDNVKFTDLRIICYSVPPQEALTKDSLTVSVDTVVYYKISNPVWAVINVANYKKSTQLLAATTLRNAIGTKKLAELLMDRPAVSYMVFQHMKRIAFDWGIKIVRVEIKDISLPLQLQKAMAAEAESSRLANAKIIVAKSEIESTKNLQKATTLLMDNPLCMQLRYLQSLHMIAGDKTHTIVFPFSVDIIKKMFK